MLAIAVLPAIFEMTQHRLMTMPWFVRAFDKVMAFHDYADQIVEPYKQAAKALVARWRAKASALLGRRTPGTAQRAARFVARRRASDRAPATTGK